MSTFLPIDLPRNSVDLLGLEQLDDKAFITARVVYRSDACEVLVTKEHRIMSNEEELQLACGAFRRADAAKFLSDSDFLLTGNNLTYIIMPSGAVRMWITKRGVGQYKDYWCTPGGIVGQEGPLKTISKELSEEVGICIRGVDGDLRVVHLTGDESYITSQQKLAQICTLNKALPSETFHPVNTIKMSPRNLKIPGTMTVNFKAQVNDKMAVDCGGMQAVPYGEYEYVDPSEKDKFARTHSFLRANIIDFRPFGESGLKDECVLFVNPEFDDSPSIGQDYSLEAIKDSQHPKMVPALGYARAYADTLLNPSHILK